MDPSKFNTQTNWSQDFLEGETMIPSELEGASSLTVIYCYY
jgi:hypothetical protein